MGKGLNWLPCYRHRQEKAKQKALDEARRKEEEKKKADEEARRKEEKRKADEKTCREEENSEANQSTLVSEQDAGNKATEPAKPSAVEEATPSSTLSIHQEVWNEAYEGIADDDPKLVESYMKALKKSLRPEDAPASEDPDVSTEMNDPVKREETMLKLVESGRKKVEKSAKVTERVGQFADGILQCKSLVDLAIQSVPQAAIPWAGVCIGLQVLCNPAKESSALREGIVHVTSRMEWYCAMTKHILNKENMELGNESYELALDQLRGRTVALYQTLLLYQMRSTCAYYQRKGLNFLRGLVNLDGWEGQLRDVKVAEECLIRDSNHYNKDYTRAAMGNMVRTSEATQNALGSINQTLQDYIASQKNTQTDSERNGCLQSLRVVDPKDTIGKIEELRDTVLREAYDWILSTKEYQRFVDWSDKQKNRVLWVHGPAGTGKTMLLIGMIRELEAVPAVYAPYMSYFFCQNDDEKINTPTAVLRSLVWLLLIQQPHLFSHILQEYKTSGTERFTDANAFFFIRRIFIEMLKDPHLGPTYLIIDALDECSRVADDGAKIENLKGLINKSLSLTENVKWIITSRPEIALDLDLKACAPGTLAQIDVQGQGGAVQAYMNYKLSHLRQREGYDDEIIEELSRELKSRADSIFLWVAIVFREIPRWEPCEAMRVLSELPSDLTKLYDNLMANIERQLGSTPQFCKNVLVATCLANRPLSTDELGVCAGLPRKVSPSSIAKKCGSFLGIQDNFVHPIHQSAKEYLEKNFIARDQQDGPTQRHFAIFQRSIRQMSTMLKANVYDLASDTLSENVKPADPDRLASIRYSCEYWVDHLCEMEAQSLQDGNLFSDNGEVLTFLQVHLLHWLESLSLMRNFSAGVQSIRKLLSVTKLNNYSGPELVTLLSDAERFAFRFRPTIEDMPLQIYGAPLAVCPTKTKIKEYFWKDRLPCIKGISGLRDLWDPCLQVLERAHSDDDMDTRDSGYPMLRVAFSPNGKTLAGVWYQGLRLWDTTTGLVKDFDAGDTYPAFSADGNTLTLVAEHGEVEIWDLSTDTSSTSPKKTGKLWNDFNPRASIHISPDGSTVARGSAHGTLTIWNILTGAMKETPEGHGEIKALAYSPDGRQVASAANDGTLQIWDVATAVCSRVLGNPGVKTACVSFSPDCRWLASASTNGLALWDIESGDCRILDGNLTEGVSIAFSLNGRMIASNWGDFVKVFDASTGTCIKTLRGHTNTIVSLAFSPDSRMLASASDDYKGRVWDTTVTDGGKSAEAPDEEDELNLMCGDVSSDGKVIALGADDFVQLRDIASGICTQTLQLDEEVYNIAFSPDSKTLATGTSDCLQIWNLSAFNESRYRIEWPNVRDLAFSPDSKLLASFWKEGQDRGIKLLDVATGKWVQTLDDAEQGPLAFSHDGKSLASCSAIWDIVTGTKRDLTIGLIHRFSKDDRCILTEEGSLDLQSGKRVPNSSALQKHPGGQLHVEGEWIMKDGQKMLWLPSEYKLQIWYARDKSLIFCSGLAGQMWTSFEFV